MNRRNFLAGAAGVLAAAPVLADAPKVFRDYDQAALDAAYDQSKYAPNLQQLVRRYATNSELTRARLGAPRRVAYGTDAIEQLDIYRTGHPNAPVHVFIHGGAWRSGSKFQVSGVASEFAREGFVAFAPDIRSLQRSNSLPLKCPIRSDRSSGSRSTK